MTKQKPSTPNLVYVFADQLRYDFLGCNGSPIALTPNIDALAKESINLENCVSNHPVCAPYRASLFTGKYTPSTGMVINEIRMNPNHKCIGHVLKENGYETAYIGKWHLYANGFNNHYLKKNSFIPKGEHRLGFDDSFKAYGFHHEYFAPKAYYHNDDGTRVYATGYEPDFMTGVAMDELEEMKKKDKPFALFLSLGTPHDPWTKKNVPEEYYHKFENINIELPDNYMYCNDPHADPWAKMSLWDRKHLKEWIRVYLAMVNNLDMNIGRLLNKLKELKLEEDTIFIFTSDHGEMFGSHGRRAKNIFYNEAVRVPFLLRYKGHAGERDFMFNTTDIMPTLLSLMNLNIPDEVEGSDLSECFIGDKDNSEPALLMGTGPVALYGDGYEWRAVKDKQYTYAVYRKDGKEFLFNNQKDPYQLFNLINMEEYSEVEERLKKKMAEKMKEIHDDFQSNSYYRKHWIKNRIIERTATLHDITDD